MSEFLAMGGYAFYVWGSFGATAIAIALEILALRARVRAARDGARHDAAVPTGDH
jgi:heme exporter protein D